MYSLSFSKRNIFINDNLAFFIKLIIILQVINITFSQLINNIIELGGQDFRYNHFSLSSKGDMIIDTTAYPGNNERRFFGLKKNGRPYFKDENENETPYYSLFVSGLTNDNQQKIEGESSFILLNSTNKDDYGKEYLLSYARDNYIELYDLTNKNYTYEKTSFFFNASIISDVGTIIKANSKDSKSMLDYIFAYIYKDNSTYRFYIVRGILRSTNLTKKYHKVFVKKKTSTNRRMVSCFQTKLTKIVCLYQHSPDYNYIITVFNEINDTQGNATLYSGSKSYDDIKVFYKGIHLRDEIGVFMYYIACNDTFPRISFRIINSTDGIEPYKNFSNIKVNRKNFSAYALLNDIIKLDDNKIAFIAPSYDKQSLNIVIINIYNDDNQLAMRYYSIELFDSYSYKFYLDLRAFVYNDFIAVAFSHCPQKDCAALTHKHYSSLIIFNYPNSTDQDFDLIQHLYKTNEKIENFTLNLQKEINYTIENNIFGYVYEGIKIFNYPEDINLYLDDSNIVENNIIISKNKNLNLSFQLNSFYLEMSYVLEYAVVLKEDYQILYNLSNELQTKNNFSEPEFYECKEYIGKTSYFNIIIKNKLVRSCNDICDLCYDDNTDYCVTCKYNYSFNNEEKNCHPYKLPMTDSILSTDLESIIPGNLNKTDKISELETHINDTLLKTDNPSILTTNMISFEENLIKLENSTIPESLKHSLLSTALQTENTSILETKDSSNLQILKSSTLENLKSDNPSILETKDSSITQNVNSNTLDSLEQTVDSSQISQSSSLILPISSSINTFMQNNTQVSSSSLNTPIQISTPISSILNTLIQTSPNTILSSKINQQSSSISYPSTLSTFSSSLVSESENTSLSPTNSILDSKISDISLISSSSTIISNSIINTIHTDLIQIKCPNITAIIEGKCYDKITIDQIEVVYDEIKSEYILKNKTNNATIIKTENVIFHISTLENQMNDEYLNISVIDLGECENKIKEQEGLSEDDQLIIYKVDLKNNDLTSTYVQYEVYNPYNNNKIDLDICLNYSIILKVPVNFNTNTDLLYESLEESGYNLFDIEDSFYNDICSTYTSINGTDVTLTDRINIIYNNNANVSLCQENCIFQYYNLSNKKISCYCSVQTKDTITDINTVKFSSKVFQNFLFTLKNSNFYVMKCFKLVFSREGQINNIGSYYFCFTTFLHIILMILFIIKGDKKIDGFISSIIFQKSLLKKKKSSSHSINDIHSKKCKIKRKVKKAKKNLITHEKNNISKNKAENSEYINKVHKKKKKISFPPKKNSKKKFNAQNVQKVNESTSVSKNILIKNELISPPIIKNENLLKKNKFKNYDVEIYTRNKDSISSKKIFKIEENKTQNNISKYNMNNYNDEELNSLSYERALLIDKRTYCQYYCSLLRKRHLLLFTFVKVNDYNLVSVKMSLFLISFSLYFVINTFFFSDKTMNRIYIENGKYNLTYQIPQIVYSCLISSFINAILRSLSLSEKDILSVKDEKKVSNIVKRINNIKKCLRIKSSIFYILSFMLMIFFWYFMSSFCAVYKNTQITLIKDTIISFGLSMFLQFGLYLIPGIFRILALRAKNKDQKCLYKFGNLISLL